MPNIKLYNAGSSISTTPLPMAGQVGGGGVRMNPEAAALASNAEARALRDEAGIVARTAAAGARSQRAVAGALRAQQDPMIYVWQGLSALGESVGRIGQDIYQAEQVTALQGAKLEASRQMHGFLLDAENRRDYDKIEGDFLDLMSKIRSDSGGALTGKMSRRTKEAFDLAVKNMAYQQFNKVRGLIFSGKTRQIKADLMGQIKEFQADIAGEGTQDGRESRVADMMTTINAAKAIGAIDEIDAKKMEISVKNEAVVSAIRYEGDVDPIGSLGKLLSKTKDGKLKYYPDLTWDNRLDLVAEMRRKIDKARSDIESAEAKEYRETRRAMKLMVDGETIPLEQDKMSPAMYEAKAKELYSQGAIDNTHYLIMLKRAEAKRRSLKEGTSVDEVKESERQATMRFMDLQAMFSQGYPQDKIKAEINRWVLRGMLSPQLKYTERLSNYVDYMFRQIKSNPEVQDGEKMIWDAFKVASGPMAALTAGRAARRRREAATRAVYLYRKTVQTKNNQDGIPYVQAANEAIKTFWFEDLDRQAAMRTQIDAVLLDKNGAPKITDKDWDSPGVVTALIKLYQDKASKIANKSRKQDEYKKYVSIVNIFRQRLAYLKED